MENEASGQTSRLQQGQDLLLGLAMALALVL